MTAVMTTRPGPVQATAAPVTVAGPVTRACCKR